MKARILFFPVSSDHYDHTKILQYWILPPAVAATGQYLKINYTVCDATKGHPVLCVYSNWTLVGVSL